MQMTEEEQAFEAVYQYAQAQMGRGVPAARVQQALVAQGWEAHVARNITDDIEARGTGEPVTVQPPAMPTETKPARVNYATPTMYNPAAVKPKALSSGGGWGGGKDVMIGGLILGIGLLVTIGTYAAASGGGNGGKYTIAWGAILFGGIRFVRGLTGGSND